MNGDMRSHMYNHKSSRRREERKRGTPEWKQRIERRTVERVRQVRQQVLANLREQPPATEVFAQVMMEIERENQTFDDEGDEEGPQRMDLTSDQQETVDDGLFGLTHEEYTTLMVKLEAELNGEQLYAETERFQELSEMAHLRRQVEPDCRVVCPLCVSEQLHEVWKDGSRFVHCFCGFCIGCPLTLRQLNEALWSAVSLHSTRCNCNTSWAVSTIAQSKQPALIAQCSVCNFSSRIL